MHTGEVMFFRLAVGGIGDLTAVGDTVNVAARLEAKSKELRWPLVASAATIEAAGPGFVVAETREIDVVGRGGRVTVGQIVSRSGAEADVQAAADVTLPKGIGAVLVENARATAEASKAALDHTLQSIADRTAAPLATAPLATPVEPESQSTRILGYKVLSKIGEGGMSTVYLAEDEARKRKAVLKVLKVRARGGRADSGSVSSRNARSCRPSSTSTWCASTTRVSATRWPTSRWNTWAAAACAR